MPCPGEEALAAAWRAEAVTALVPHVAHRVNNALSVVRGLADLLDSAEGRGAPRADRSTVSSHAGVLGEQAGEAARLQSLLAELATGHAGRRPHDLTQTLQGLAALFDCVARAARHALDVRHPGRAVPVDAHAGAVLLCGALLSWAALGGPEADRGRVAERGPGRMRLSVRGRGPRAALGASVLRREEAPAPEWDGELRAAAETCAVHAGGRLRARRIGRALALSLVLPTREELEPPIATASRSARLLVVEPDDLLASLLGDVLRDAGYRVSFAKGEAEASSALSEPVDAVLVEAGVRAEVDTALVASGAPLLTLGVGPPPFLRKPFRPAELLRLVAALLGE